MVSKKTVEEKEGVVILPLKEYLKLLKETVPTYYLTGKVAERLDREVESALRERREGKTIKANSIDAALKIYARKKNRKNRILK